MMNSKLYDVLKVIAQVWIPAIATLWYALAGIWNWPFREEVLATLTAIDAAMGAILQIDNMAYKSMKVGESTDDEQG